MYEIRVRSHFDAAHALRGYRGKCESLHGHRYQVVACVQADEVDDIGLVYDFTALKGALQSILERFDHGNLNEIPPFDEVNPSSENIARVIYDELIDAVKGAGLSSVEVWESPDAWVTYSAD
jgi:6-pyruvoyltetrahydropterin/6-carboxytetrahydropterin synthase